MKYTILEHKSGGVHSLAQEIASRRCVHKIRINSGRAWEPLKHRRRPKKVRLHQTDARQLAKQGLTTWNVRIDNIPLLECDGDILLPHLTSAS